MFRCSLLVVMCLAAVSVFAQHPLDKYLAGTPTPTTIGTAANAGLDRPVDLEFNLKPGRTHELWVLNRDDAEGSSMSIFFDANTPQQVIEKRKDSHRGHFMINCPAFAMSDTGDFCTVQEVLNSTGHQTETFMGPVLWTSDTNVFARYYQSDWDPFEPLGSHIDMLHQSPYAMGVAWEKDNIYWVFDGYNGNIVNYNFQTPHEIGGDDHSDGILKRYTEVQVKRVVDIPSHMVIDHKTGWLYIVDNGNKRVLRLDTKSGVRGTFISNPYENLEDYFRVKNVTWEVFIDSGLVMPVGVDVQDGRLVVTDNSNGDIIFYNTTTGKKNAEIGRVKTGKAGIAGITIGPDSTLWYVVTSTNEVIHLQPSSAVGLVTLLSPADNSGNIKLTDTLRWLPAANAVKYHLQILDSAWLILDTTVVNTYFPMQYFLTNSNGYNWRVQAIGGENDTSTWTEYWYFTTITSAPWGVALFEPENGATNVGDSVYLRWGGSGDPTEYRLIIRSIPDSSKYYLDSTIHSVLPNESCILKGLPANMTYEWYVVSSNEGGVGPSSEKWTFTRGTLGVDDVRSVSSLLVYPNPASSTANISLSLTEATPLTISLYSLLGENMMTIYNGHGNIGVNTFTADISKLAAGVYHLRIETSSGVVVRQILVQ